MKIRFSSRASFQLPAPLPISDFSIVLNNYRIVENSAFDEENRELNGKMKTGMNKFDYYFNIS